MFKNKILSTLLLSAVILTSFSYSPKATYEDPAEVELKKVIVANDGTNTIYDDGVLLESNESMDVSQLKDFKVSNTKIAQVKNGVLTAKQEGTTFISYTDNDAVHIKEVSVASSETLSKSNLTKTQSKPSSRNYYKVSIDPGHGGIDPGAIGNGLEEKVINLETAKLVGDILDSNGINVEFTRIDDSFVSLLDRVQIMNSYAPDVAVSIHYNAQGQELNEPDPDPNIPITFQTVIDRSAYGIETYYTGNKLNKQFASDIQTSLISNTGANPRGIKTATFTVIQKTNCTSALVEGGFITNTNESNLIHTLEYKKKIAQGIADGIMVFLKNNVTL